MTMGWRRGTFEIRTQNGSKTAEGFVAGNFGIRDVGRYRSLWSVTHVPTGLRLTPGSAGFTNLDLAKAFAEKMASLADWSNLDAKAENRALEAQMVAIWNELIALDTVKALADHYNNPARR